MRVSPVLGLALVAMAVSASGCHRYLRQRFPAPQGVEGAPLARSTARRVVVALVPPGFQDVYASDANDTTYTFDGASQFYGVAFQTALSGRVAALEMVVGTPPPGFDVYLYPQLQIEVRFESGFFNRVSCIARYNLIAADGSGQVIAQQAAQSEETFVLLARANDACEHAMTRAFREASWPVLQAVDLR